MELKVENLHKSFDGQEVLHGISFSIQSGKPLGEGTQVIESD